MWLVIWFVFFITSKPEHMSMVEQVSDLLVIKLAMELL